MLIIIFQISHSGITNYRPAHTTVLAPAFNLAARASLSLTGLAIFAIFPPCAGLLGSKVVVHAVYEAQVLPPHAKLAKPPPIMHANPFAQSLSDAQGVVHVIALLQKPTPLKRGPRGSQKQLLEQPPPSSAFGVLHGGPEDLSQLIADNKNSKSIYLSGTLLQLP